MRDKCVEMSDNANKMRDRFVELLQKRSCFYNKSKCNGRCSICDYVTIDDDDIDNLADYLLVNSVVALPCKVGDGVYQTDGVNIYENEVCEISLSKRAVIYYTENAVAFDETALGKSIFLTKEEAERALKGGKV